jgi:hypothetical protein
MAQDLEGLGAEVATRAPRRRSSAATEVPPDPSPPSPPLSEPLPTSSAPAEVWNARGFDPKRVELFYDADVRWVQRRVTYGTGDGSQGSFTEPIFPIYVPPVAEQTDARTTRSADQADPTATTDAFWAKAPDQARSTAKWIATVIGAALAAIVGTAPLSPLGGKDIDWVSLPGFLIVIGLVLLGGTIFLVLSVLVPGIPTFADLMKPIPVPKFLGWELPWWIPMSTPRARWLMAEKVAEKNGVQLPIGIHSLNELGYGVRIEEMTLDKIAERVAQTKDKVEIEAWTRVKTDRGHWLESLKSNVAQWTIVGSYLSVKVRSDRARSIGLVCGIVGGALLVAGYIGVQAPSATQETVSYVVIPSSDTSQARKTLGAACDVFTAVLLATDKRTDTVTLYITGGNNCTVNERVELPAKEIAAVTPGPTPTKTS